jgi:hypothetical protein
LRSGADLKSGVVGCATGASPSFKSPSPRDEKMFFLKIRKCAIVFERAASVETGGS